MEEKTTEEIWRIEKLQVLFKTAGNNLAAVNEITLTLHQGEHLCLLGESGCGKSVFGTALLKLLPENAVVSGKAFYKGIDTTNMCEKEFRRLRGSEIAMIPQGAGSSLDPTMRCGKQVEENLKLHTRRTGKERKSAVLSMLKRLELPRLPFLLKNYPFELSGGMKQRILVAAGVICHPRFLLIDEPTKGLDNTRREKVINMLNHLVRQEETSALLITHDFYVADRLADQVAVMYAGEIVEYGRKEDLLKHPIHPYTKGLLAALPQNGFHAIEGFSPPLDQLPAGCRFHPRCPRASERCALEHPELIPVGQERNVRCFLC